MLHLVMDGFLYIVNDTPEMSINMFVLFLHQMISLMVLLQLLVSHTRRPKKVNTFVRK